MRVKPLRFLIPLLLFLSLIVILWRGLSLHPEQIPSPLINHPMPVFQLPHLLSKQTIQSQQLLGKVTLINVFASWCETCVEEHSVWMQLIPMKDINFIGFNYKDERDAAKQWLHQNGNPYQAIAVDHDGKAAIDWGVYGTPETFIIDKHGIIRYKHIGAVTLDTWQHILSPLILKLQRAS